MASSSAPSFFVRNRHYQGFAPISSTQLESVRAEGVRRSYAAVVGKAESVPLMPMIDGANLPKPSKKGNEVVITLSEEVYQQSLTECKSNLIGRIYFSTSSQSISVEDVCQQASNIWKPAVGWRMVSIGKGFFDIHFATVEEMQKVQAHGSWLLPCGVLRVIPWQADINPKAPKSSHAQIISGEAISRKAERQKELQVETLPCALGPVIIYT